MFYAYQSSIFHAFMGNHLDILRCLWISMHRLAMDSRSRENMNVNKLGDGFHRRVLTLPPYNFPRSSQTTLFNSNHTEEDLIIQNGKFLRPTFAEFTFHETLFLRDNFADFIPRQTILRIND